MKKIILLLILVAILLPYGASALTLNLEYPTLPGGLDLNDNQDLNDVIAWFYMFIIGISGLAAFVMIVWGGIQWMSSAGNPTLISDAQSRMKNAILGLLLILSSFIILQIINPELLSLQLP